MNDKETKKLIEDLSKLYKSIGSYELLEAACQLELNMRSIIYYKGRIRNLIKKLHEEKRKDKADTDKEIKS